MGSQMMLLLKAGAVSGLRFQGSCKYLGPDLRQVWCVLKNVLHTLYHVKTNVEADLLTGRTEDFVCQINKKTCAVHSTRLLLWNMNIRV